ncbi:Nif3-like dinuclear metal center hexameric protein [Francisella noatunensis]
MKQVTKPDISVIGECNLDLDSFSNLIENKLDKKPSRNFYKTAKQKSSYLLLVGAQDYIEYAYQAGTDTLISGEISERTTHTARENLVINYIAAGHNATEKEGVKAIAELLKQEFVPLGNPL